MSACDFDPQLAEEASSQMLSVLKRAFSADHYARATVLATMLFEEAHKLSALEIASILACFISVLKEGEEPQCPMQ